MRRKFFRTSVLSAPACFGTNCFAQVNNSPSSPLSCAEQAVGSASNAVGNALQQDAPYSQSQAAPAAENQAAMNGPQTSLNTNRSAQSRQSNAASPNVDRNSDTSGSANEYDSSANVNDRN